MPPRVRQALLDGAVGVPRGGRGQPRQVVAGAGVDVRVHLDAEGAGLVEERGEVGERRLRGQRGGRARRIAQHPKHAAQLVEGRAGVVAHHAGGRADLCRVEVVAVLQRPRVQGDERQPVGEHVVHLPGDPGALAVRRLRGSEGLLLLREPGALPERRQQLAAAAEVEPEEDEETEHHEDQRRRERQLLRRHGQVGEAGDLPRSDGRDPDGGGGGDLLRPAADRERHECDA